VGYHKQRESSACFSSRERHLVVPEGIPSQFFVQARLALLEYSTCDLTHFCL
jgi:hypothetical protein